MKSFIQKTALPLILVIITTTAYAAGPRVTRAFIGAGAAYPEIGAEVSAGLYQRIGYGYLSASYGRSENVTESIAEETGMLISDKDTYTTTMLNAGYRLRVFSFAYHNVNLYVGVGAFSGFRNDAAQEESAVVDEAGQTQPSAEKAVYGVRPDVEAEFFLGDRFALTINGAYVNELSADAMSGPRVSAGFRIAF